MGTGISETIWFISQINAFYDSSWNKLIWAISIAFAVIGIIVPLLIQWYQGSNLKRIEREADVRLKNSLSESEESLRKDFDVINQDLKRELREGIENRLDKKIQDYDDKLKKLESQSIAAIFHLQGNTQRGVLAISDYISAANNYIECKDNMNLQTMLTSIKKILPQLSIQDLEYLEDHWKDIKKMVDKLEKYDTVSFYTTIIQEIKALIKTVSKKEVSIQKILPLNPTDK
ncbi:MAG: hypothetical protein ACD_80C00142G0013 [uncultured bacterium (gcode 4)]|uniref:Uncharacterized protein n=1 Tax=uncultured bacterium (gcode 4) TaxID=1234023 RepID=K1XIB1_9BACT|nr:MAG: hypothetical protein ACD_80C00142G0013 [uncultured bacterium (gcode 4)]